MNEVLWFSLVIVTFSGVLLSYRLLSVTGLVIWIAISVIVANVQVVKVVEIFGLTATLGNVVYASTYLATDILSELHGPKLARRGVFVGFFALVTMTVLMLIALYFVPSSEDFAQDALKRIFLIVPRITAASLAAYLISQLHDVWIFGRLKRRRPGTRHLWLRNNVSTALSQLIDSIIFTLIAFAGVFAWPTVAEILITTYLFKLIAAVFDTPFVYLAARMRSGRDDFDAMSAESDDLSLRGRIRTMTLRVFCNRKAKTGKIPNDPTRHR